MKNILLFLIACLPLAACGQASFNTQNLERYITFRAEHSRYSGVTVVYKDGERIFESVHGLANRSWQVPNTIDTRFDLASVTKLFTATAIGLLHDRGQIALDEPFVSYFPDFPNTEIAGRVTVRQLLSHTSGISDLFIEPEYLQSDRYRLRALADYDRFYETLRKGEVPPGSMHYSNTNYLILGRIIEKVTGRSYYTFVQEEIFDKIGMAHTGFYAADLVIPKRAEGYTTDVQASMEFGVPNDGALRRNSYMRAARGMPAGGAYATAHDLYLFLNALRNGQLVKPETFSMMVQANERRYGLGMQTYRQSEIAVYGHSGGFYGVSAMAFLLPEQGYTFISLTNNDFGAQPVFDRFLNNLAGLEPYEPIQLSAEKLTEFEGTFEVYDGERNGRQIPIEALSDRLLFDGELEFFPVGQNRFFDIDNDRFTLTFKRDSDGQITGFTRTDHQLFVQKAQTIDSSEVRSLQPLSVPDEVLFQYLGEYQFGENGMMPGHRPQISVKEGALLIDNMMRFLPYEKDKFYLHDDIGMRLHFQRNGQDQITGIHVMREDEVVGNVTKLNQN